MTVKDIILKLMEADMDAEVIPYTKLKIENVNCEDTEMEVFGEVTGVEQLPNNKVWIDFEY